MLVTGIETPKNIEELRWSGILLSDGSSEEVIGWGRFERRVDEREKLFAILVASYTEKDGLGFGYAGLTHPVLHVIFCKMSRQGEYWRMSIGRVFDKNAVLKFQDTPAETIRLV